MPVKSYCSECFLLFNTSVCFYEPSCHGPLKHDPIYTILNIFTLNNSSIYFKRTVHNNLKYKSQHTFQRQSCCSGLQPSGGYQGPTSARLVRSTSTWADTDSTFGRRCRPQPTMKEINSGNNVWYHFDIHNVQKLKCVVVMLTHQQIEILLTL